MIMVYIGYLAIFVPLREKNVALDEQVSSLEGQLKKYSRIIQKADRYGPHYQEYMAQYRQTVAPDEFMSHLSSQVVREAEKFNVRMADLKPQKVKKEDFYNNFSISVTLEGSLPEIIKLIHALQGEPHLFIVSEARFNQHYQRASTVQCQFVLSKILFL